MNTNTELTFRELTKAEKQFVVTTFTEAVDTHSQLKVMGKSRKWMEYSTILEALNIHGWPDSNSNPLVFVWFSASLEQSKYTRLRTYSVFWARSFNDKRNKIELWIGRKPHKPSKESDILSDAYLVSEIIDAYGLKVSEARKYYSISNRFLRYKWVLLLRVVTPLTLSGAMLAVGLLH